MQPTVRMNSQLNSCRPWLASLLSFTGGPVGHVYAGAIWRCAGLWAVGVVVTLSAVVVCLYTPNSRIGFAGLIVAAIGYPIFLAIDAYRTAAKQREVGRRWYQRWWMCILAIVGFYVLNSMLAATIRWQIGETFEVPTAGMATTILPGDRIVTNKLHYHFNEIQRGDVVVFLSDGPGSPIWVFRIIGVPGDEIEVRDEVVLVNGTLLDEPYAQWDEHLPIYDELASFATQQVPDGHVFLMGDNRRGSKDSRIIGFVPATAIVGLVRLIYWSHDEPSIEMESTQLGRIRWERVGLGIE